MRSRRATSLAQLMVVMSACSVILTMSAELIHRMMRTQSKARSFFDIERSTVRLSHQFRRDAHAAIAATADDVSLNKGIFLRLRLPDEQTVEYQHQNQNVIRVLSKSGKPVSREEFSFPSTIKLSFREEASPRRFILAITAEPEQTPSSNDHPPLSLQAVPVSFQVVARLGWLTQATVGKE
jgi:hypothetical protein